MPVTILGSEAIVLSALRYGETSKIVRLATREVGVVSAIAKGALRPRSRFGAALQVLSRGQVQLLPARQSDLHTLTAFDLIHLPGAIGQDLDRYAGALALAEVVQRCAPADPHPEVFESLGASLDALEAAPPGTAAVVSLRALWTMVGLLGFSPALDACVVDGTMVPADEPLPFSLQEGGALCPACARSHAVTLLPPDARRALAALLDPSSGLPDLDARHLMAHRRLLARFIQHQLAEGAELRALEFWLTRRWERT